MFSIETRDNRTITSLLICLKFEGVAPRGNQFSRVTNRTVVASRVKYPALEGVAGSTYTHGPLDTPSSHGTEFYQLIRKLEYLKPVILELKENAHTYHQTYGIEHPPSS